MEPLEQVLTQYNPVDTQRPAKYAVFMVKGVVPFGLADLSTLWGEWSRTGVAYQGAWAGEKERFFSLFTAYNEYHAAGRRPTLAVIYPNGTEMLWTLEGTTQVSSARGAHLAQVAKALKMDGDVGLAAVVQFGHNDDATLYTPPVTRNFTVIDNKELLAAVGRAVLDTGYGVKPSLADRALPVTALEDFWAYFRNRHPALLARYGTGSKPSSLFKEYKDLYQSGGYEEFFTYLTNLDTPANKNRLLFASFIYDAGFQYALYRVPAHMRVDGGAPFFFAKLPATPGTKWMTSRVPVTTRLIVKAVYLEKV